MSIRTFGAADSSADNPTWKRLKAWLETEAEPDMVYPQRDIAKVLGVTIRWCNTASQMLACSGYHTVAASSHPPVRAGWRVWGRPEAIAQAIAEGY